MVKGLVGMNKRGIVNQATRFQEGNDIFESGNVAKYWKRRPFDGPTVDELKRAAQSEDKQVLTSGNLDSTGVSSTISSPGESDTVARSSPTAQQLKLFEAFSTENLSSCGSVRFFDRHTLILQNMESYCRFYFSSEPWKLWQPLKIMTWQTRSRMLQAGCPVPEEPLHCTEDPGQLVGYVEEYLATDEEKSHEQKEALISRIFSGVYLEALVVQQHPRLISYLLLLATIAKSSGGDNLYMKLLLRLLVICTRHLGQGHPLSCVIASLTTTNASDVANAGVQMSKKALIYASNAMHPHILEYGYLDVWISLRAGDLKAARSTLAELQEEYQLLGIDERDTRVWKALLAAIQINMAEGRIIIAQSQLQRLLDILDNSPSSRPGYIRSRNTCSMECQRLLAEIATELNGKYIVGGLPSECEEPLEESIAHHHNVSYVQDLSTADSV